MKSDSETNRNGALAEAGDVRNPFGVMDVPAPNDREVVEFAAGAKLEGSPDDENAGAWGIQGNRDGRIRSPEMPRRNGNRAEPRPEL